MNELLNNYNKLSKEKQMLIKQMLEKEGININTKIILPQPRDNKQFPLSFAQQRLWFLEKLEPGSNLYVIPSAVELNGKINKAYLVQSINMVAARHEILRTKFIEKNGTGYQEIVPDFEVQSGDIDLSNYVDGYEELLHERINEEFSKSFKLDTLPLFRVVFIKVSEKLNYLLLPMHHIVSDNWSTGILIKEIIGNYEKLVSGADVSNDSLKIQYADYSVWQREWLKDEELEKQKKHWVSELSDSNSILEIVSDKKRPYVQTYSGAHELFTITEERFNVIKELAKSEDVTLFVILLAAYQYLLSKYSNQQDINVGIPIANRNRNEIEELIGFFINTLVLRGTVNQNITVSEFLKNTKKKTLEAYSNQDIPFEMIVDELNLERDMSHSALFQAMLVLNNAPMPPIVLEGVEVSIVDYDTKKAKFDLVLSFTPNGSQLKGKLEYNTDIYSEDTIKSFINNFISVLDQFVVSQNKQLADIEILNQDDKFKTINQLSPSDLRFNEELLLHREFEKKVTANENKIAITDGENEYSYLQLSKNSDQIAHSFISKNIKLEQRVGIFLDRQIDFITSILGILKSGAAFVPIDINLPQDRIQFILEDSNIDYVITSNKLDVQPIDKVKNKIILEEVINENIDFEFRPINVDPNNLAYIIYTSGTTGNPKGVMVEHSKIGNHITLMQERYGIHESDTYLAFAAFNFDPSIEQLFVPLLTGAKIFLRGNDYWTISDFIKLINEQNITVINPPTVYWNQFISELTKYDKNDLGNLRLVIAGGEEMKVELLTQWKSIKTKDIELINAYGPTETVITSSLLKTDELIINPTRFLVPIGNSPGLREIYIIDNNNKILPNNIPGELCFGGNLLARGYQNDPAQTAEKFRPDPFSRKPGSRFYRTGDLARYDSEGRIEFIGRADDQVKIRGFRIELSEIEQTLVKNSNVKEAAVIVKDVNKDNKVILAYVVLDNKVENINKLHKFIGDKLPNYMLPDSIITLDKLPINSNGKLDKKKLLIPDDLSPDIRKEYIPPRSELEISIAKIVSEILGIENVGIYDSFFDLGGHSILAIKTIAKIREEFGVEVQLKELFEKPNIIGLSEAVVAAQSKLVDENELEKLLSELEN